MDTLLPVKNNLAIFDIDGTLTDSISVHQSAFIKSLEHFGLHGFNTDFGSYKHHTDSYIFKTIFENQFRQPISPAEISRLEDLLYQFIASQTVDRKIAEIDGAKEFLHHLKYHSDFDIVFATGSLLKPAKLKLKQAGIATHDDLIISANSILSRDDLIIKAIEQARQHNSNGPYRRIVSFGDGKWDFETARNTGVEFAGIGDQRLLEIGVPNFFRNYYDIRLPRFMGMQGLPDFTITDNGFISREFTSRNIFTFCEAASFVSRLPYRRNTDKNDPVAIFAEHCGTCSTKHATLMNLAIENKFHGLRLMTGIFRMNSRNMPRVSGILLKYHLDYIPEAHNYLRYAGTVLDFTFPNSGSPAFLQDLIEEIEISPRQITDDKAAYHKAYLKKWLTENQVPYTLPEVWAIREECIRRLSAG